MKIVQINATCGIGSTGKICSGISRILTDNDIENYILCSKSNDEPAGIACSNSLNIKLQAAKSRIFGNFGFNSKSATRRLIKELERINPDAVHLHNVHGHDCNLELLFKYFKAKGTRLIWTFHDCWAFTAYCPHFDAVGCDCWKEGCHDCPQIKRYSWFFDRSREMYERKKELFRGLDLTIITPSQWLADLVKQSFLGDYPVKVINNGIDLDVFKPIASNFKSKYDIEDKKMVLGVAFDWGERKGLDVFVKLASRLPAEYQIVLVGTNGKIDKLLPDNIISIHRTQNQQELAEIYSAADVFVNPTREENYPTVNMESIACGTPVITFKTGGSPETIDETTGFAVEKDDVNALEREIIRVCSEAPYTKEACAMKSKSFDKNTRFQEYLEIYK